MIKKLLFLLPIKKNLKKKSIRLFFLFLCGLFLLPIGGISETYAQTSADQTAVSDVLPKTTDELRKQNLISRNSILQVISSVVYVILWPLIALAGLAMDNQLIYGSFMHLDNVLWKVWQLVRTFANYALGVMFLVGVLLYNLSPNGKIGGVLKGLASPKDLITKTLVAAVLIQASWFILMACVDLSTVLTYTIGAIPTSILATTDKATEDSKMLMMNTVFNLGDAGVQKDTSADQAIVTYRTTSNDHDSIAIAPCKGTQIKGGNGGKQTFIIGRAFDSIKQEKDGKEIIKMQEGYCIRYGALVAFNDFYQGKSGYSQELKQFEQDLLSGGAVKVQAEVVAGKIIPWTVGEILPLTGDNRVKNQDACPVGIVSQKPEGQSGGNVSYGCLYEQSKFSLSNLIEKSKSMTGPFVALYSNSLSFADLTSYQNLSLWQEFIVGLINAGFAVCLVLPLAALVIVLFARVGILWVAIALSPFIVLLALFKGTFGKNILPSWLEPGALVRLLLTPVLVSFAVSLSMVFMTALKSSIGTGAPGSVDPIINKDVIKEISGMNIADNGDVEILNFIRIKLDNGLINLSWMLTMIFGIAITWFLLFRAIKQTQIGKKVGESLQKFGENTLGTLPIIPIGDKGVGFKALIDAPKQMMNEVVGKLEAENNAAVRRLFDPEEMAKYQKEEQESQEKVKKLETMKTYFNSGTPENLTTTFNVDHNDVAASTSLISELNTYRKNSGTMDGRTQETIQGFNDAFKNTLQNVRNTTKERAKNSDNTNDGSIIAELKSLLNNPEVKEFNLIDEWKAESINIGSKVFMIKYDTSGEYILEETTS